MPWGESLGPPLPGKGLEGGRKTPPSRSCPSPRRSPPGVSALLSPGHVFLFAVMETSSSTRSARAPSMPLGRKSTSTRWLSVPPGEQGKGVRSDSHPRACPAVPSPHHHILAPSRLCSAAPVLSPKPCSALHPPPLPPNAPHCSLGAPRPSSATCDLPQPRPSLSPKAQGRRQYLTPGCTHAGAGPAPWLWRSSAPAGSTGGKLVSWPGREDHISAGPGSPPALNPLPRHRPV